MTFFDSADAGGADIGRECFGGPDEALCAPRVRVEVAASLLCAGLAAVERSTLLRATRSGRSSEMAVRREGGSASGAGELAASRATDFGTGPASFLAATFASAPTSATAGADGVVSGSGLRGAAVPCASVAVYRVAAGRTDFIR